jgi:PAS domain S-box-containing protein
MRLFTPITLATASVVLIFLIDFTAAPDLAIGILYLVSMVLVVNEKRKTIISFAIISSLLILFEFLLHYRENLPHDIYGDMALSLTAIWISCSVILKFGTLNKEKMKQQTELIEQEKKYHKTIDGLIEGAQIIGADWKYVYVNDAVVEQSKFSREELLGHTMMEKYPGIENSDMFRALKFCMEEHKSKIIENEFTFPDGSVGYFLLSIQPVPEGVFILSMDISDGKRREQNQKQYISELEEMIFLTSHKVRQPWPTFSAFPIYWSFRILRPNLKSSPAICRRLHNH